MSTSPTNKKDLTNRILKGGAMAPVQAAPAGPPMSGQTVVAAAGTAVELSAPYILEAGVWIKALTGNGGSIYVGPEGVNSTNGYVLAADETVFIETNNLHNIFLDTSNAGDGVSFLAS